MSKGRAEAFSDGVFAVAATLLIFNVQIDKTAPGVPTVTVPGGGTRFIHVPSVTATYADPASDIIGFAEVYTRSPRDGTIDEIVRVPLVLSAAR